MSQNSKRRKRTHPIARYLIALAMTFGGYTLYTTFVVPLVEPERSEIERPRVDLSKYQIPIDDKSSYQHLFAQNDWELETCKTLEISQGKILFQDYQRHGDGTWDVFPFTMILNDDPTQAQPQMPTPGTDVQPFVLRSRKGAKLIFDRPIQLGSKKEQAKLERAQLKGNVQLYRNASAANATDSVKIATSNVQLTKSRIFTLDDVWFQFGNNHGNGRNLSIDLSHKSPSGAIATDFSKINGITKIQLAFLQKMRIEPSSANQPQTTNRNLAVSKVSPTLSSGDAPLEISAAGAFTFDLATNRAEFHENVVVKKLDQDGDTLQCNDLLLQFKSAVKKNTVTFQDASNTDFELQTIDAVGSPNSPCVLNAKSQQAQIVGQRLFYHIPKAIVKVTGREQVEIKQNNKLFRAKSLLYNMTTDRSLGDLDAEGPGIMLQNQMGTEKPFRAAWNGMLTIRDGQPNEKLILLGGGSLIEFDRTSSIKSDDLEIWLNEQKSALDNTKWDYEPKLLVAKTNVQIESPDISGTANQLNAKWQSAAGGNDRTARQVGQVGQVNRRLATTNFVRRVSYQQAIPANDGAGEPAEKLRFKGNVVDVVLGGTADKTKIVDLTITDNVQVWQKQRGAGKTEITADFLRAIPQLNDNYRIQVKGTHSDSVVISDQMKLTGKDLRLDQQANSMWVTGTGALQLTGKIDKANMLPNGRVVDVNWTGGMIFDGQKIYFEENVGAKIIEKHPDGSATNTRTLSEALSIVLSKRFDFAQAKAAQQDTDELAIREMIFLDELPASKAVFRQASATTKPSRPIALEHETRNARGQVQDIVKVIAPRATVRTTDDKIIAHGPGSVIMYRRGAASANGLGFARQKDATPNPNGLTLVHSNFDRSLVANTKTQEVDISGNTRTIYMPVQNTNQSLNPDTTKRLPEGAVKLTCSHIKMTRWTPRSAVEPTNELIATGNAQIASPNFKATAERLSYHQQSDMLTIEGNSRTDARLWFRKTIRDSWNPLVATKIRYRLSDQWTDIQNVKNATLSTGR